MTLQDLYTLLYDYKPAVLVAMLFAPWIALGLCIAIPGDREEPFILSFNLSMAVLSLLLAVGYLWYATHTAGLQKVIQQADILLMLAPCYYVSISLWVARQRLPLTQIPAVRIIQGIALIGAGYLGVTWILSKLRILVLTFLPFPLLLMFLLGLAGLAYLGYLKITDQDSASAQTKSPSTVSRRETGAQPHQTSIDDELEALRRDLENKD